MHAPQAPAIIRTDYRPDIDGLRAIAVLSVLAYHLGIAGFSGGFVGVDIFFVISGFLITGIVKRDVEGERFSFYSFYARRARRLMPAMIFIIIACWISAFLMLEPSLMRSFARSALATLAAVSNILFWQESNYFDVAARFKPLLHTWSLSVEWQFYAVWPAFIALALTRAKQWSAPAIIAAVSAASFIATVGLLFIPVPEISDARSATFYLMPFRIFEFGLGALVVWLPTHHKATQRILAEVSFIGGLSLIVFSAMYYTTRSVLPTALPVVGATLAIIGSPGSFSGAILRNRVSAFVGKISYSIYLVHWPLIVFTEYFQFGPLSVSERVILFALSIALGAALYLAIERPFHERGLFRMEPAYAAPALLALSMAAVAAPTALAAYDGIVWRVDGNALGLNADNTKTIVDKSILGRVGCEGACVLNMTTNPNILIVGDSHVDHYSKTLEALGGDHYKFFLAYGPSCFFGSQMASVNVSPGNERVCRESITALQTWTDQGYKFNAIVISQLWSGYLENLTRKSDGTPIRFDGYPDLYDHMLADIDEKYQGYKGKIVIVGRAPNTNLSCYLRPTYLPMHCPRPSLDEFREFRAAYERFAAKTPLDVSFVAPVDTICPEYGDCRIVDDDGHILYTDAHHLSIYGARLIVPKILATIKEKETAVCSQGLKTVLPKPFVSVRGFAYASTTPALTSISDDINHPARSPAILCEDGRSIGQPHIVHEVIGKNGGGTFSHWGDSVIFSASDNSDPNKNGRVYSLVQPND
jgi:peptidoglycan/LPS O-acetylase OafA/YrhL